MKDKIDMEGCFAGLFWQMYKEIDGSRCAFKQDLADAARIAWDKQFEKKK